MQYYDYNDKVKVKDKLFTPTHGVKLTGGLFRRVFDNNREFTKTQLDIERTRYWFDKKRGIEPKVERYPGHFEDNLKGQTASQYLMCAGNVLRWEEDEELRRGMNEVLDFIEDTAEPDGFLMPIDEEMFAIREYPHYVRIWLTYGLIAAAKAGEKRALVMLRRWQDWFNSCPDLPVIKYLELAFQGVVASPSVYLTEIGKPEDIEIGRKYYEETWRLAQFIAREPGAVHVRKQHGHEPHPHGSELEGFEGYLDLYRCTGAPYFLNAVRGCIELYRRDWQHVGGGIVMIESFPGQGNRLAPGCNYFYKTWEGKRCNYNELCCSSFWLHLHQRMHRLFPDEESHVFEIEQSLYNVAIANQNGSVDIRYCAYLDEQKQPPVRPNHCCSGVGTRIFGSLPEYLFSLTPDTLSVDLFGDCELNWETKRGIVKVTETTDFPYNGKVNLKLGMEVSQYLTIRIRIPCWADGEVPIKLNGEEIAVGKPGSFAVIARDYSDGDEFEFEFRYPVKPHLYHGIENVEGFDRYSYTVGPILMAVVSERNHEWGVVLPGKGEELAERLTETSPLHYDIAGTDKKLVPYFELVDEKFTCFPMFAK